jgi:head-tail adaptor
MNRPGPQVNFKFSVKPEGGLVIDGYEVFENGVKIENPPEDEPYGGSASPLQYFASAALYDLFYVAQTLHGPIHILHYVLTNALKWGATDSKFKRLSPWADVYNSNVNNKYNSVATVLIALTGNGLLTSANGLGGSDASQTVMKENIEAWGACSTVHAAIRYL